MASLALTTVLTLRSLARRTNCVYPASALPELKRLVTPGGRVLLGEGFWHRTPTETELAGMWPGTSAGEFGDLARLVGLTVGAGFRPAWIETATRGYYGLLGQAYLTLVPVS
jgi:hypothetical protein